jgi:hypothetical protein
MSAPIRRFYVADTCRILLGRCTMAATEDTMSMTTTAQVIISQACQRRYAKVKPMARQKSRANFWSFREHDTVEPVMLSV